MVILKIRAILYTFNNMKTCQFKIIFDMRSTLLVKEVLRIKTSKIHLLKSNISKNYFH